MNKLFYFLGIGLLVMACEKVIDIDLNDANPKIVVEAELFNGVNDFKVKLSETSSYFKNEDESYVTDAVVKITENGSGRIEELSHIQNGEYLISEYEAKDNEAYTLSVDYKGTSYASTAAMPKKVMLDSLVSRETTSPFGGETGYLVFLFFQDEAGVDNYYRVLYKLNGEEQRSKDNIYILDDNFTDGNATEIPLFVRTFEVGDTVDLKFLAIDPASYEYLITLNGIIGNGQPSAAPANPNGNFTNGALGYFAVYNGEESRIIISE